MEFDGEIVVKKTKQIFFRGSNDLIFDIMMNCYSSLGIRDKGLKSETSLMD